MVAAVVAAVRHVCMCLRPDGLCLLADRCSVGVGGLPALQWLPPRPSRVPAVAVVFSLWVGAGPVWLSTLCAVARVVVGSGGHVCVAAWLAGPSAVPGICGACAWAGIGAASAGGCSWT